MLVAAIFPEWPMYSLLLDDRFKGSYTDMPSFPSTLWSKKLDIALMLDLLTCMQFAIFMTADTVSSSKSDMADMPSLFLYTTAHKSPM